MPALPKLLIVDDEAPLMKALCQTLECEGYAVTGFTSATQAVATLRQEAFDLVLSDLMMPEMDGIALVRVALEIDPNLIAIVMTGYGTIDTAVQAMKEGAQDYILKPFKLTAILPVLARALAMRRMRLENIQLHQAVGIYELSIAIALAPDCGTILQKFADAAFRQIGATHVSVLLPSADEAELKVAVARGNGAGQTQGLSIPLGRELARWLEYRRELLSRAGEPVDVPSFLGAPLPGLPLGLSIPMLSGGKPIGVLHFCCAPIHSPVSAGLFKTLNILAGAAASALEGALLVDELRAAEQRYRRLAENAPDAVFRYELHPRRRCAYVNPVVAAISGYSPEEFYADPELCLKVVHADDRPLLETVLQGNHPNSSPITLRWIHKNGSEIWIEQNQVLVRDGEDRPAAIEAIARDITERRNLEEQLRHAQRLEGIGRLAGGVAHDFNNLLTVINGYTNMALDELPSGHPLYENLQMVGEAAERAAALTQQLLAFSRKQLIKPTVLNLNTAVVQIEKMLTRLIGENIDIRTKLAPDLGNVFADSGQLQQVIMNLAVNGRDAMPRGGSLLIETRNVQVDGTYVTDYAEVRQGPHVLLGVSDTGTGITREVQARMFEPFFTTKPQGVGTGLGLATVYGIVKQAGGWIWVYSEPGHGSTFKIYLPRIDEPITQAPAIPRKESRGSETILVVEDQPDVRKMTVTALKKLGYKVHSASRPDEALALAQSFPEPIHLLLTDVVMPRMTGRELADRMVKLLPGLPVLFMSGYTDDAIVQYGVLDAGVAYIAKPFTADSLGQKVRETLSLHTI